MNSRGRAAGNVPTMLGNGDGKGGMGVKLDVKRSTTVRNESTYPLVDEVTAYLLSKVTQGQDLCTLGWCAESGERGIARTEPGLVKGSVCTLPDL